MGEHVSLHPHNANTTSVHLTRIYAGVPSTWFLLPCTKHTRLPMHLPPKLVWCEAHSSRRQTLIVNVCTHCHLRLGPQRQSHPARSCVEGRQRAEEENTTARRAAHRAGRVAQCGRSAPSSALRRPFFIAARPAAAPAICTSCSTTDAYTLTSSTAPLAQLSDPRHCQSARGDTCLHPQLRG